MELHHLDCWMENIECQDIIEGGKFYYLNQTITVTNGTTNPNPFIIDVTNSGLTTVQGSLSDQQWCCWKFKSNLL